MTSFRLSLQRFGSYLSGMIMPNIGAFIAWGIITALFIPDGWIPNENLATLVEPMINYLLPLLIGFTGGRMVYELRGGVVGATATMGVIVGADIPMFLGAMIMGPFAGYLMKLIDRMFEGKIRSGFEMLYNNFSAGILAAILASAANMGIGPIVQYLNRLLANGVEVIINAGMLPLTNMIIEPAKILFLNNAINHGILSPIGVEQAAETGKSILFLLETNPGPGLGILLAFSIFGKGTSRSSAPGAVIIQFLGGIHEIYFPYVLMKPLLIIAVISGGVSGVFFFNLFDSGLIAAASPGSIFAIFAMTAPGSHLGVILGVIMATLVSFIISSFIIKMDKNDPLGLEKAREKMGNIKGKPSSTILAQKGAYNYSNKEINKIVFACDAGMGSSAMGASLLKKKFSDASIDIDVKNTAINNIPSDANIIITHKDLTERANIKRPEAEHISVDNFLNSPKYDELVNRFMEES
ncbi:MULTISPECIES: PTS mannitol transporter subunit IICB [Clostridia]|uniref:PTS mannitol transporter subunit IICB n=1 Tax=Clostridia TaxID=186801 RepID=UPI000EA2BCFE|nr:MULTISPECIES: PTS mannitol transporter subunit IICB [Clostridia]NBJ70820.1 PTS mannitol transporter subunit IICBA [Roseburia sp. 1XD42-34]RKI75684.1 PTS mannitol transporter subunit IICB [Clostridium sp. 1xD42-85]